MSLSQGLMRSQLQETASADLVQMHEISAFISVNSRMNLSWLACSCWDRIAQLVQRQERTTLCQVICNS